ncbi:Ig-like domain-containing protein [Pseudoalteromonas sp. DL2-H2.2]|uniref:tandem-95 repeat protein n=1 Tax=Pseudoalteromonas sp. DL2-H2.2 TaxID=2908889 RepID=UPI001F43AD7F|nr:Ig-like domain-containing protein [Pseudoalteromonas sp. DL2-H2.2]MCF2910808.1 Ig-like domain-containing protein [Pseudoalteromonas sp. DL2-H2.2]
MSLSDKNISKKSKLARHIQAALLGGVALSAGFTSTSAQAFLLDGNCSGIPGDPDCNSNSGGGNGGNSGGSETTNSQPTLDLDISSSGTDGFVRFKEGADPLSIAPNANVTDDKTISSIKITLVNPLDGADEWLSVNDSAMALDGFSGAGGQFQPHSIEFSGAMATPAEVEALLKAVTYTNTSTNPNETQREIQVTIQDHGQLQASAKVRVNVVAELQISEVVNVKSSGLTVNEGGRVVITADLFQPVEEGSDALALTEITVLEQALLNTPEAISYLGQLENIALNGQLFHDNDADGQLTEGERLVGNEGMYKTRIRQLGAEDVYFVHDGSETPLNTNIYVKLYYNNSNQNENILASGFVKIPLTVTPVDDAPELVQGELGFGATDIPLTQSMLDAHERVVKKDAMGNVHVVYHYVDPRYSSYLSWQVLRDGQWVELKKAQLNNFVSTDVQLHPQLHFDSNDLGHVVFSQNGGNFKRVVSLWRQLPETGSVEEISVNDVDTNDLSKGYQLKDNDETFAFALDKDNTPYVMLNSKEFDRHVIYKFDESGESKTWSEVYRFEEQLNTSVDPMRPEDSITIPVGNLTLAVDKDTQAIYFTLDALDDSWSYYNLTKVGKISGIGGTNPQYSTPQALGRGGSDISFPDVQRVYSSQVASFQATNGNKEGAHSIIQNVKRTTSYSSPPYTREVKYYYTNDDGSTQFKVDPLTLARDTSSVILGTNTAYAVEVLPLSGNRSKVVIRHVVDQAWQVLSEYEVAYSVSTEPALSLSANNQLIISLTNESTGKQVVSSLGEQTPTDWSTTLINGLTPVKPFEGKTLVDPDSEQVSFTITTDDAGTPGTFSLPDDAVLDGVTAKPTEDGKGFVISGPIEAVNRLLAQLIFTPDTGYQGTPSYNYTMQGLPDGTTSNGSLSLNIKPVRALSDLFTLTPLSVDEGDKVKLTTAHFQMSDADKAIVETLRFSVDPASVSSGALYFDTNRDGQLTENEKLSEQALTNPASFAVMTSGHYYFVHDGSDSPLDLALALNMALPEGSEHSNDFFAEGTATVNLTVNPVDDPTRVQTGAITQVPLTEEMRAANDLVIKADPAGNTHAVYFNETTNVFTWRAYRNGGWSDVYSQQIDNGVGLPKRVQIEFDGSSVGYVTYLDVNTHQAPVLKMLRHAPNATETEQYILSNDATRLDQGYDVSDTGYGLALDQEGVPYVLIYSTLHNVYIVYKFVAGHNPPTWNDHFRLNDYSLASSSGAEETIKVFDEVTLEIDSISQQLYFTVFNESAPYVFAASKVDFDVIGATPQTLVNLGGVSVFSPAGASKLEVVQKAYGDNEGMHSLKQGLGTEESNKRSVTYYFESSDGQHHFASDTIEFDLNKSNAVLGAASPYVVEAQDLPGGNSKVVIHHFRESDKSWQTLHDYEVPFIVTSAPELTISDNHELSILVKGNEPAEQNLTIANVYLKDWSKLELATPKTITPLAGFKATDVDSERVIFFIRDLGSATDPTAQRLAGSFHLPGDINLDDVVVNEFVGPNLFQVEGTPEAVSKVVSALMFSAREDNTETRNYGWGIQGTEEGTQPTIGDLVFNIRPKNTAPSIATNKPVQYTTQSAQQGVAITQAHLNATDSNDTAEGILYKVVALPESQNGTLYLNDSNDTTFVQGTSNALALGDTFTQQDVNDGKVQFIQWDDTAPHAITLQLLDGLEDGVQPSDPFVLRIAETLPSTTLAVSDVNLSATLYGNTFTTIQTQGMNPDTLAISLFKVVDGQCTTEAYEGITVEGTALKATSELAEGSYSVCIVANDGFWNTQQIVDFNIINNLPLPAPSTPDLLASSDTGINSEDNITKLTDLEFSGTAVAGSTVTLYSDVSGELGTVTVGSDGSWQRQVTLSTGRHKVTAIATSGQRVSPASASLSVVIDNAAPTRPADFTAKLSQDSSAGNAAIKSQPTYEGTAPGLEYITITVKQGDFEYQTVVNVAQDGTWTHNLSEPLADGNYTIAIKGTDAAGNEIDLMSDSLLVDTTPLAVPVIENWRGEDGTISSMDLFRYEVTGSVSGDVTDNDRVKVVVETDTKRYEDEVTINPQTGQWRALSLGVSVSELANETEFKLTVVGVDAYGNTSVSVVKTATLDLEGPQATITASDSSLIKGESAVLQISMTKPVKDLTLDAFRLWENIGELSDLVKHTDTSYSVTYTPFDNKFGYERIELPFNKYQDVAGNIGKSTDVGIWVDTALNPDVSVAFQQDRYLSSDSNPIKFVLYNLERHSTYTYSVRSSNGGLVTGSGSTDNLDDHIVEISDPGRLKDGQLTVSVFVKDKAGNAYPEVTATTLMDKTAPRVVTLKPTDNSLSVGETALINITLSEASSGFTADDIEVSGGALEQFEQITATEYRVKYVPFENTRTQGHVKVKRDSFSDAAGNINDSNSFVEFFYIDTQRPDAFEIALDKTAFTNVSASSASVTLIGAELHATYMWTVTGDNVSLQGEGRVSSNNQQVDLSRLQNLADGTYTLTLKVVDAHGNTSDSIERTIIIDNQKPTIAMSSSTELVKAGETATLTFTFSEPVVGFTLDDILPVSLADNLSAFTEISETEYSVVFTPDEYSSRSVWVVVNKDTVTDDAGNELSEVLFEQQAVNTIYPSYFDIKEQDSTKHELFNAQQLENLSFTLEGADVKANNSYHYTLTDSQGNTTEGRGTFDSSVAGSAVISGLDVSSLVDGLIKVNVTLINEVGNVSNETKTWRFEADRLVPWAQSVDITDGFQSSPRSKTVTVNVSEPIESPDLSFIHVTNGSVHNAKMLNDSLFTFELRPNENVQSSSRLTIEAGALTDKAGNKSTQVLGRSTYFDTQAPSGHTVALNHAVYNAQNTETMNFVLNGGSAFNDTYTYVLSSSNGGAIEGSGQVISSNMTVTVPSAELGRLKDGALTLSLVLSDRFDNKAEPVIKTVTLDRTAPLVSAMTVSDQQLSAGESGVITITLSEASSDFNMAALSVTNGELSNFNAVANSSTQYQVTYTPASDSEATGSVTVNGNTFTDVAGNPNTQVKSVELTLDTLAPTSYSAAFGQDVYSSAAQFISFDLNNAEAGATYRYEIQSEGAALSGTGTVSSANERITLSDIRGLNDGPLSLSVTLTDKSGNVGVAATDTATLDTRAPGGHSVTLNQRTYNASTMNSASFSFDGGEVGATYTYTLTSSGGGSVTGSGTLNSATQTVSIADVSNLKDGALSLSVVMKDSHGNTAQAVVDSATLDATAPLVATLSASDSTLKAGETSVITLTLSEASNDFNMAALSATQGTLSDFTAISATQYKVTFNPDESNSTQAQVTVKANSFSDVAGNRNSAEKALALTLDTLAPTGYSAAFGQDVYSSAAQFISFDLNNAEAGATYRYEIQSEGAALSGTGTVSSADERITLTDIRGLNDGPLSLSVTLTDKAGNVGVAATDTATLDTRAPGGHSVTLNQRTYNASTMNSASFSFAGGEVGATYTYTLTSSGGSSVTGSGTLNSATQTVSIADVSNLKDGALSLSVVMKDSHGNTAQEVVDSATLDATAPLVATLSASDSTLKAGETSVITITLSEASSDFSIADLSAVNGTLSGFAAVANSTNQYQVIFTPSSDSEATGSVAVNSNVFTDAAGNQNAGTKSVELNIDTQAPTGYAATLDKDVYNSKTSTIRFDLSGGEAGATYAYTLSSEGHSISGTGTLDSAQQQVAITDIGNLNDGPLSLSVALTDKAGNAGVAATDSATLDTAAPSGHDVMLDQQTYNLANRDAASISFSGAEVGATYAYTLTSTGGGELTGTDTITAANQQVNITNLSQLKDGTLSLSVVLTDSAGNAAEALVNQATLDATAPTVTTLSASQTALKAGETSVITIGLSEAVSDFNKALLNVAGGTVSELEQISDTSYRTVFTPSENSQAAGTIAIAAGKFNDTAGNPNLASDTLTLNIDTQAPGNHSVAFGAPYYHGTNANAASITLGDAEVGSRYHYVISSAQGGLPVSAQGEVTESNQTISGINLSNLNDGQLNVTVTLTDPAGNVSQVASATTMLDTAAPQVVSLTSNDPALKVGEQALITIALSEPSEDFTLEDISASSGSLSELKALNATTYQATFTPDENAQGDVTISIAAGVFNDAAGNANTAAEPLVLSLDTTAPSGQSVSIDQTLINRDNETAMSFTLNGLEGKGMLTYQVSDGTTSVGSQSPISITAATQSVTGVDVSALAEGRLILTVVVYDDANNAGEPVTAAVTKKYNVAPVLSGTPQTTVNEDAEYVFEPELTDPDSDDTHTFVISNKPDWASFDEQTGKLSGTPGDEHVGNYEQIVITVNDGKAEHALSAFNIEVVNTNDAPVAQDFSFTLDEAEQLVIALEQGLLSTATDDDLDSEDSLSAVVVGEPQFGTLLLNADGSFTYSHDGSENHSDSFTYQVKDTAGELSQTRTVALTINPLADAPVTLDDTLTVTEDTPNTLDLLENDFDAENDMVAASAAVVTEPQLGSYTITNGKLTYTPNENATGQDTLTYTVKDAAGNTSKVATLTISIVAVNDQPVAKGATLTVEEDTPSDELDVRTLSSDIEDTHPQGEVVLSVLPSKGVVTVNQESGKLVYTPNANATGSDAFSYTIADSEGLVSEPVEVIVNIGAVNDRPVADGDSVTLNEDETGTLNILDNDTDVEDQGFNGANVMLEDKGNGAGAYELADVTVLADGQLEITPKADVNGSLSFTYTLMDSEGLSSEPATVNIDITPVNDAPVAVDNTAQLEEEGSYEVNVLGDDYDVDANDQLDPGSVTVVAQPQSGQVTVTESGAIVYVPNANFNGLDTFTYTVKDAAGAVSNEALVTMTVTPVNDAPVADAQVLNVSEDGSVLITLTATDIDADALSYQIVQGVNSGTLTQQSDNSWLYTPNADFNGEDSLQFVAFDGQAESEPVQVTLNVTAVNDAPVITGTPATGVDQDTAYRFTPDATDLDGDSLTFSIENQPVWANFDTQSGTLSGTPGRDDVGNYANIVISVADGELSASLPAFTIEVGYVNAKPVAQTMQVFVDEDASTSFSAPVSDPDQDSLSITVTQQPASGTLSVQGTLFSYIPGANFNGADSFSYVVNDGEMNSDEAQVSITVNAVNDTPVAQNDAFSFGEVASSYSLDVLANDSDVDAGDTLTLVGASASIGSVAISEGQLVYQPQASAQDTAVITYMLADSAGARAQATATVEITASAAADAPTLSVPDDMSVDATGLFTKVDLGTASAFDSNGNPLAVSLVDGVTIFAPGLHQVYWKATDGNDQSTVKKQTLAVNPLVSLSKDSQIAEEQSHTVKVFLNGPAPSYPITVPYTVSGSADGNDHDLLDGEVVIESGTEASITFNVFADGTVEGNESIVITLADTLNRGAKSSSTVTIVEDNVAPALAVDTTQNGESRTLILQNGESVVVSAAATDANPQDSITLSWEAADAQMTNLSLEAERFEFDPSVLTAGIYKLSVTATDDGAPALSSTQDIYLEVVDSLPQLSGVDSDGDLIPDDQEGFADSDNDGIPDYLDANSDCNVIPGQVKDANQYLVEGEPGVCLRKGATVAQNSTGGAQLLETELPADSEATNIGGVFDFIATGLPKAGDVYGIVIPQRKPIPVNAIYRKFRDGEWVNFVTTDGNAILSATGEPGYCPPPGSNEWRDGLNEGDWCVQLQIVDGGPNDDDGIANGSIVDPGGIAVLMSDNTQPVAQADTLAVGAGLPVFINVLENDSDADGDTLTITGASADFGVVEILDNQLRYTPPVDYVGTATITYSIADGQGGTSSATVTVELVVNAAPVTQLDTASTNDQASVILDVLANDMDPDGDALTLISATATHGKAVVNLDGTLSYEPKLGFNGEDTVTYQVKDAKGATSTGIAKINVTAHQVATVENKSSGSLGGLLMIMVSALVLRRRKSALPAYAVVTASCLVSAPALADAWRVQATLGQAEANSHFSALPAGIQVSNVDDSSQSWSAGAFYQLMPKWYAGLRYIDLGQGRVTLSGSTLTPDSWQQSMARVAPVLPEGFALQTGLEVARFDKVHGELFLGAYNWDYQIDSTLNGRHFVQYEQKGTSAYFGGAVGYQLSDSTALTLSYSHYRLSANRIGEVAAGIEVRF